MSWNLISPSVPISYAAIVELALPIDVLLSFEAMSLEKKSENSEPEGHVIVLYNFLYASFGP